MIGASAICGASLLMVIAALWTLQSEWFKEKVQQRIILLAERASGGRVEFGESDYNWRTLTAHFSKFALHGTEPADARPLFRADSIRVGFRVVSILSAM